MCTRVHKNLASKCEQNESKIESAERPGSGLASQILSLYMCTASCHDPNGAIGYHVRAGGGVFFVFSASSGRDGSRSDSQSFIHPMVGRSSDRGVQLRQGNDRKHDANTTFTHPQSRLREVNAVLGTRQGP